MALGDQAVRYDGPFFSNNRVVLYEWDIDQTTTQAEWAVVAMWPDITVSVTNVSGTPTVTFEGSNDTAKDQTPAGGPLNDSAGTAISLAPGAGATLLDWARESPYLVRPVMGGTGRARIRIKGTMATSGH